MPECIFCKIVNGQAPATIVYKENGINAFLDIHPVAPTHILIVPDKHISSVNDILPEDEALMGQLFSVARELAEREGIHKDGYRLIVNTGAHGGQVVYHLHMHLMGGQRMRHPIG
jgi:histidine triad (HIT) family protein